MLSTQRKAAAGPKTTRLLFLFLAGVPDDLFLIDPFHAAYLPLAVSLRFVLRDEDILVGLDFSQFPAGLTSP